jgi:Type II secretion system (T2SS), protein F
VAAALRAAAVRVATGVEPRSALTREAERFHLPVLVDVGDAVDRHRRLGTPLPPALHRIAARQRADDRARLLERAARRGPLATLVVALVIAPVCLAALTACMIGGLVESGSLGLR